MKKEVFTFFLKGLLWEWSCERLNGLSMHEHYDLTLHC